MKRVLPVALGLGLAMLGPLPSCGIPCDCPEATVVPITEGGDYTLVGIEGSTAYDGGDSDEWTWEDHGNPFDNLFEAAASWQDRTFTVDYETSSGTWRVVLTEG